MRGTIHGSLNEHAAALLLAPNIPDTLGARVAFVTRSGMDS
jgi:hypothetical protein